MTWNKIVSGEFSDVGLLIARLGIGPAFIAHGWDKIMGGLLEGAGFAGMLSAFGGAALPLAWLVAIIELVGGLMILLGLFPRVSGLLIAGVMTAAMIMVKFSVGFLGGWELDFAFFSLALLMFFAGPGKYALERVVGIKA